MALGDTKSIVPRADQQGTLGTAAKGWGQLFIENPSDGAASAVLINNLDANQVGLNLNGNNDTGDLLNVRSVTLTTGSLAKFVAIATPVDGASNNLIDFDGTFAGTGTSTFKGAFLDVNKSGITASGKTATLYGMHIDLDDAVTNVGAVTAYGLMVQSTFANTGGTINNYGIYAEASGGDNNYDLALATGTVNMISNTGFTLSGMGIDQGAVLTRRKFSVTTTDDGNHDGDVVYFGAGEELNTGKIHYLNASQAWVEADADAASTASGLIGVALGPNTGETGVLLRGMVTLDHDPGAIGDVLYVSTTAGDCSATAPSGTGDIVRIIGYQVSHASDGNIWFNPDNTFVEIS